MAKLIYKLIVVAFLLFHSQAFSGDPFRGQAIYNQHCAGCHGGDGKGVIVGTPNFIIGSPSMMKPDFDLVRTIKQGAGIMPGFQDILKQDQIYDVIAHIRTFF